MALYVLDLLQMRPLNLYRCRLGLEEDPVQLALEIKLTDGTWPFPYVINKNTAIIYTSVAAHAGAMV